jgi:hypothetical protein
MNIGFTMLAAFVLEIEDWLKLRFKRLQFMNN